MTDAFRDDDLTAFAAHGATLPPGGTEGVVETDGASIWYADFGSGAPVFLLHGGMGHASNFGHEVPALVDAGYRAIAVDSRGHGHSTNDGRPYSYAQMARDVVALMDQLAIPKAAFVGWSDGACTALELARSNPERSDGVFFFACNVDSTGTEPFVMTPVIGNCIGRHRRDYEALSATPDQFDAFMDAVGLMQRTQPEYSATVLEGIRVPVTVAQSEHDEFITPEHAQYIARTIPNAELVMLPGVSHFAPLQRPALFNAAVLAFLARVAPKA